MNNICEVCGERDSASLCDYATGTGVVTSATFQEITETCDKRMCKECSVKLWANCDVCPDHAKEIKNKLEKVK